MKRLISVFLLVVLASFSVVTGLFYAVDIAAVWGGNLILALSCFFVATIAATGTFLSDGKRINLIVFLITLSLSAWLGKVIFETDGRDLVALIDHHLGVENQTAKAIGIQNVITEAPPVEGAIVRGRPIDRRSITQVLSDLESGGIHAQWVPSSQWLVDAAQNTDIPLLPLSGVARKWAVMCDENANARQPVTMNDRYGLNNDDTVYALKKPRILLLGDSYIYGQCVHQEESVAGVLRRRGYAAISAGLGGSGPLAYLGALREYGSVLKPKAVVWFHFDWNDMVDMRDGELRSDILINYLDEGFRQNLANRQDEVDAVWDLIDFSQPNHALRHKFAGAFNERVRAIREGRYQVPIRNLERIVALTGNESIKSLTADEDLIRIFIEAVKTAKRDTEGWGGKFYFGVIRSISQYRGEGSGRYLERILEQVRGLGIPVVDIDEAMQHSGDPLAFYPRKHSYPHHNARGYAELAMAVQDAAAPISVTKASYGLNCFSDSLPRNIQLRLLEGNVTDAVDDACFGTSNCSVIANTALLGGDDPLPSCQKAFSVEWNCPGSPETKRLEIAAPATGKEAIVSCIGRRGDASEKP